MKSNYIIINGLKFCMLFEGKCDNEGDCDSCKIMNGYIDYCNKNEKDIKLKIKKGVN